VGSRTCDAARTSSRPKRTGCSRSTPGSTHRSASRCSSRPTIRWRPSNSERSKCCSRSGGSRSAPCSSCCCSAYRCSAFSPYGWAVEASEGERRRIARDLHDGVVQELAGTAFALSGTAREPSLSPALREELIGSSNALRRSLRQLRSLLVEIHPPGLNAAGLGAALEDLSGTATSAGIATSVSVIGVEGAPDHVVTLVWRVAQEAIRNAVRHAHASQITVEVLGEERQVRLTVQDNGLGFDASASATDGSYGLRGLRSLVEDGGGRVQVESRPGAGTTVRMVVDRW
jgi:two-component system NarL family sensor kinase